MTTVLPAIQVMVFPILARLIIFSFFGLLVPPSVSNPDPFRQEMLRAYPLRRERLPFGRKRKSTDRSLLMGCCQLWAITVKARPDSRQGGGPFPPPPKTSVKFFLGGGKEDHKQLSTNPRASLPSAIGAPQNTLFLERGLSISS